MKIQTKDIEIMQGIEKEWLITNGIGGYSASTILGINTRKYHGLLIAPLTPPARRYLILSKLDESIEMDGKTYNLYSNICRNFISDGFKYQEEFEKEYIPIFTYKVENVTIKKLICLEYGKNTVCVLYKIDNKENKKIKLNITPVMNFRDFHTMTSDHIFNVQQKINKKKVKLVIDNNLNNPVYMYTSDGNYIEHQGDTFYNMHYVEEEKRGFFPEENLSVPGTYEVEILGESKKEIEFICSLEENIEEINVKKVINKEIIRINEFMYKTEILDKKQDIEKISKQELEKRNLLRDFVIAIDNFIVYRPSFALHTIIAGYPWFLDWGRDTLISFEGLLLCTKQYDIAKDILLTTIRDIKFGLVPNGYSGYDNRPLYNSVDSSLLLFEAVYKYLEYTGDYKFIESKIYDKLVAIIENYSKGIDLDDNNIFLDKDGLISSGTENTQNTWMDAKYGNYCFTPRNGKTVEVNSMWYNSLKILEELSIKFGKKKQSTKYKKMAEECKKSFEEKFYNKKKKCLYDVLGDTKTRPNQLFATSLSFPVLNPNGDIANEMFETVTKKLLNKYGLKTLAKGEKNYIDVYEGDSFKRDSSYHQGITWPWLLGLYYNTIKNKIRFEKNKTNKKKLEEEKIKFEETVRKTYVKDMYERGTIGTIGEIYDSKMPNLPRGTMAQAWSIAEIFRIIKNYFGE
ncbi:MAG: glycogen debranching enzyme N-terminal domain-containing protein [Clostridia bacterium]|nr:glycogen debranching enzyme N-terminal domain-containing protein [Clostridia bacterium]